MSRRRNGLLIAVTLLLYGINQCFKRDIPHEGLRLFMCGYFNDIVGSITFLAYVNLVLSRGGLALEKLWQILLMMLGCGFFWEVITPLFRKSTVADFWDGAAYLFGGLLYWLILQACKRRKVSEKQG